MVHGEVLVGFRPGVSAQDRAATASTVGGTVRARTEAFDTLAVPPGDEVHAAARLAVQREVAWAEPNVIRQALSDDADEIPWGLDAIRAPQVWGGATGAGVRVAVIDSGVAAHPELAGRVEPGRAVVGTAGQDPCGHGTAVAGVIAAAVEDGGTAGVAPDATIVPVTVLTYDRSTGSCIGDDASIATGIRWAADPEGGGVDVINLSLGSTARTRVLAEAVAYAQSLGVLVVAAAGDFGNRLPVYPAALPGVISVGGVQRNRSWDPAGSFGAVDVAAPSRAIKVLRAPGVPAGRIGSLCPDSTVSLCASGTSYAAAHVSGVAALLLSSPTHAAILADVPRTSWPMPLRQWIVGTTNLGAPPSPVELERGHGLVDALNAVSTASGRQSLVTWSAPVRVMAPAAAMKAAPAVVSAQLQVTDGRGAPLAGVPVSFAGGNVTPSSSAEVTDGAGRVAVEVRPAAAGAVATITATAGGVQLPLQLLVLSRDDNAPGVKPPGRRFSDAVDLQRDLNDVFKVWLRRGERLDATAAGVTRDEYVDLALWSPGTRDVTNAAKSPLSEVTTAFEVDPLRLRARASTDGQHLLDVSGHGTYRLTWSIWSPGKIQRLTAAPSRFSPDGDGYRDATVVRWRQPAAGRVRLEVRSHDGRLRRTIDKGNLRAGDHAQRWNGRTKAGGVLPNGRYRVTVVWSNATGRTFSTSVAVTIQGVP